MHHNSTNYNFFSESDACNSTENDSKYSIVGLYDFDSVLKSSNFITLLLEYKQTNSYQIWRQNTSLLSNEPRQYTKISGDIWEKFTGLAKSDKYNCLDFTGINPHYYFSIGTYDRSYGSHIPGLIYQSLHHYVYFADLWIQLKEYKPSCRQTAYSLNIFILSLTPFNLI